MCYATNSIECGNSMLCLYTWNTPYITVFLKHDERTPRQSIRLFCLLFQTYDLCCVYVRGTLRVSQYFLNMTRKHLAKALASSACCSKLTRLVTHVKPPWEPNPCTSSELQMDVFVSTTMNMSKVQVLEPFHLKLQVLSTFPSSSRSSYVPSTLTLVEERHSW
jgi:hypothetical protein